MDFNNNPFHHYLVAYYQPDIVHFQQERLISLYSGIEPATFVLYNLGLQHDFCKANFDWVVV